MIDVIKEEKYVLADKMNSCDEIENKNLEK